MRPCVCDGAGLWGCEGVCVGSIRRCGSSCPEARTRVAVGRTSRRLPPALGPPANAQQWGGLCSPCPPTAPPGTWPAGCGPPRGCAGPGRGRAVASSRRKPWVLPVPGVVLRAPHPQLPGAPPRPPFPREEAEATILVPVGAGPGPGLRGGALGHCGGHRGRGAGPRHPSGHTGEGGAFVPPSGPPRPPQTCM